MAVISNEGNRFVDARGGAWDYLPVQELNFPVNPESLSPRQIGRLVAEQLVAALPGSWRVTADGIRCSDALQMTEIVLQRGGASRQGHGVWIYPRLIIRDVGLSEWSAQNPGLVEGQDHGTIFNSLLVNFTAVDDVFIAGSSITSPQSSNLDEFLSVLLDDVIPQRELMREPQTLLRLPDRWLWDVAGMLLWSVSAGHADLCWGLIDRSIGADERRRAAFILGMQRHERGESAVTSNACESLGGLTGRLREQVTLGAAPAWLGP